MRCQRQLLGVRWSHFVTNVTISESTGFSEIRDIIAGRRHSLFGYIRILPANVSAHMALKLSVDLCSGTKPSPDWTRPQGRPLNTWVKQLVADSGIAACELWEKARNRKYWVALRPRAGSGKWLWCWWWWWWWWWQDVGNRSSPIALVVSNAFKMNFCDISLIRRKQWTERLDW